MDIFMVTRPLGSIFLQRLFVVDSFFFLFNWRTPFLVLVSLCYMTWWKGESLLYGRIYPICPLALEVRWKKGQWPGLSQSDGLTQDLGCGWVILHGDGVARKSGRLLGVCVQWWQSCPVAVVTKLWHITSHPRTPLSASCFLILIL